MKQHYPFPLLPLPYAYDGLIPELSKEILFLHHDKHLKTYVDNLNKILAGYPKLQSLTLEELLIGLDTLPREIQIGIQNNGGGVYNHNLYFACMSPEKNQSPQGELLNAINRDIGSFEEFVKKFTDAALGQFGSGYAWLVSKHGKLQILNMPNQNTPISKSIKPILNLDVWEHAYYLQYQNRRNEYVENWFHLANWNYVNQLYLESCRG